MSAKIIFLAHDCNVVFIVNELHAMLQNPAIESVTIYTDHPINDIEITSHSKCQIRKYQSPIKKPGIFRSFSLFLTEWIKNRKRYKKLSQLRDMFFLMWNELKKASYIEEQGIPEHAVLYSYWGENEAFILSELKARGYRNLALTRMHAFDIYEEFDNNGSIPWRWFILRHLDRFITISMHGQKYFASKYPLAGPKTKTFYLGINGIRDGLLNPVPDMGFKVVSCGWVNRHKNHVGILHALTGMENTSWMHIGNGDDFEKLRGEVKANPGLKVDLRGAMSQEAIKKLYATEPFTCFISLSTTEGIPVSMMEALACGIPVVTTDVGGCGELVGSENGVLLPVGYSAEDVKNAVRYCAEKFSTAGAREAIRQDCLDRFDAGRNYLRFFEYMDKENQQHYQ